MLKGALLTALWLMLLSFSVNGVKLQPCVEVLIPRGMPIKVKAQLDPNEANFAKYIITRTKPKGVLSADMIAVMVDMNRKVKILDQIPNDELVQPLTIVTTDKSITRLLIIVERVKTKDGEYVAKTDRGQLDIEALVKDGAKALPPAKFIKKKK